MFIWFTFKKYLRELEFIEMLTWFSFVYSCVTIVVPFVSICEFFRMND